jgi:hypothetical protein
MCFLFGMEFLYSYYLTLMNSTFCVTDSFIIRYVPVILSTRQIDKYLSNTNILHPQVIQGCRGVNASLESQVEVKETYFLAYFLLPD